MLPMVILVEQQALLGLEPCLHLPCLDMRVGQQLQAANKALLGAEVVAQPIYRV